MLTLLKQIFYLLLILIVSWVLIHFMAIFGIFLAVAIPILHLIFYPRIVCFWCQLQKNSFPHTLRHSFIDAGLVMIFTLFSIGIVIGESRLLKHFGFPGTERSVSFIIPARGQFRLGEIFPMKIEINGIKTAINTVQADLSFDPSRLEVIDINTEGSFASIFLQKEFSNELGYARLTGGLPNPGFNSPAGVFGTVYFRGKSPGLTEIKFLDSSLVLANDGRGSNVLKDLASASYLITPDEIPVEEAAAQVNLILGQEVLGAETALSDTSLEFYGYSEALPLPYSEVLGTSTTSLFPEPEPPSLWKKILSLFAETIARIDSIIVDFWYSLLGLLR